MAEQARQIAADLERAGLQYKCSDGGSHKILSSSQLVNFIISAVESQRRCVVLYSNHEANIANCSFMREFKDPAMYRRVAKAVIVADHQERFVEIAKLLSQDLEAVLLEQRRELAGVGRGAT